MSNELPEVNSNPEAERPYWHHLLIDAKVFAQVLSGRRKHFIIENKNIAFIAGDYIVIKEKSDNRRRQLTARIQFVDDGPSYGLESAYCVVQFDI